MPKTIDPSPVTRRRDGRQRRITGAQRDALAALVQDARRAKGWTRPQLAMIATSRLERIPGDLARAGLEPVAVSKQAIEQLESGAPTQPMGTALRRARLLGIVLALGLDRAEVNLIGGGI